MMQTLNLNNNILAMEKRHMDFKLKSGFESLHFRILLFNLTNSKTPEQEEKARKAIIDFNEKTTA